MNNLKTNYYKKYTETNKLISDTLASHFIKLSKLDKDFTKEDIFNNFKDNSKFIDLNDHLFFQINYRELVDQTNVWHLYFKGPFANEEIGRFYPDDAVESVLFIMDGDVDKLTKEFEKALEKTEQILKEVKNLDKTLDLL